MDWGGKEADMQFINNYRPEGEGHQHFRILLHGPAGAGKSSFTNSVISVLEGRISSRAGVCNDAKDSYTNKYKTYSIKQGNRRNMYPFVLNDMMGLENAQRRHRKVHEKDVKKALKGHIKDGYTFNPESSLSKTDPFYNANPTINDKVHILVSVIDANTAHLLGKHVEETIQDIRDEATELGIPHVIILTKIDLACPEIKKDLKNFCRSKLLRERVQAVSSAVGIPEYHIFPVKNYHSEMMLDNEIDTLVLKTLKRIIEVGDEHLRSYNWP